MDTYTDVVSALAIWVADPLVSLRRLPPVVVLEKAEGEIDESEDLEDGVDYVCVDVDGDPGGWENDIGEDADVQQSFCWAGKLEFDVGFELSIDVEHVQSVNIGVDTDIQGDEEINFGIDVNVDTQDQIDLSKRPRLGAEVLLVNDWVVGAMTLELPCSVV